MKQAKSELFIACGMLAFRPELLDAYSINKVEDDAYSIRLFLTGRDYITTMLSKSGLDAFYSQLQAYAESEG